jgi:hypothetical protein
VLKMNFHFANGIYFRRTEEDKLRIVRAQSFDDAGEVLVETDIFGFASIVSSFSPFGEQSGSFDYIVKFLRDGIMYCAGCGAELKHGRDIPVGNLSIVNLTACQSCYERKFKPLFDWGCAEAEKLRKK